MTKKTAPQRHQLSDYNKHQLEGLRRQILKELKERYPRKKTDYGIPPEERCPTTKELEMILLNVERPVYKLYFETLAFTGARPCEINKIKLSEVDFKNKCVYVWVAKKNNKIRLPKPFPSILEPKLKAWVKGRFEDISQCEDYVFFNRFRDKHIEVREASKVFRNACDKALGLRYYTIAMDKDNFRIKNDRKLRNITLKSLRKYFESKVYEFSGDGLISSRLLHHEHIDTTNKHYLAITKKKKKEVVEKAFRRNN